MPKKSSKNEFKKGNFAFDAFYGEIFFERWQKIKNAFCLEPIFAEISCEKKSYFLDVASAFAAFALPVKNAKKILDMCAAPGGKSLLLALRMNENAELVANERSKTRKNRLKNVLSETLPENIFQKIKITCNDGAKICLKTNEKFDAILLDAPCSSERHIFLDKNALEKWTIAREKNLSFAQWALFSSAWRLLNRGGFLLYSTCALTKRENDFIAERALKKFLDAKNIFPKINYEDFKNFLRFLKFPQKKAAKCVLRAAEKTQYGFQFFPDKTNGSGPIYFSLFTKI